LPTTTDDFMTPDQAVPCLASGAKNFAKKERRFDIQFPLFRHASIYLDGQCFAAYIRNISDSGIALMHSMDLPLCEVELSFLIELGRLQSLRARVERCEQCSDGLYFSGLMFL
jgi:hypothetical protein